MAEGWRDIGVYEPSRARFGKKLLIAVLSEEAATAGVAPGIYDEAKVAARLEFLRKRAETGDKMIRGGQHALHWTEMHQLGAALLFRADPTKPPHATISTWQEYENYVKTVAYLSPAWTQIHNLFLSSSVLGYVLGLSMDTPRVKHLGHVRGVVADKQKPFMVQWSAKRGLELEDTTHAILCSLLDIPSDMIISCASNLHESVKFLMATPDGLTNFGDYQSPRLAAAGCLGEGQVEFKNPMSFARIAVIPCGTCSIPAGRIRSPKCGQRPCSCCIPCAQSCHVVQSLLAAIIMKRSWNLLTYTIVSDKLAVASTIDDLSPADHFAYVAVFRVGFDDSRCFFESVMDEINIFIDQATSVDVSDDADIAVLSQLLSTRMRHGRPMYGASACDYNFESQLVQTTVGNRARPFLPPEESQIPEIPGATIKVVAYDPEFRMSDALLQTTMTRLKNARIKHDKTALC